MNTELSEDTRRELSAKTSKQSYKEHKNKIDLSLENDSYQEGAYNEAFEVLIIEEPVQ